MKACRAYPSASGLTWGVDTLSTLTQADALRLVAKGVVFRVGYIDHVTPGELEAQLGAGLLFSPVTYALEFDGAHTVARLEALGIPKGVTAWLDLEQVKDPLEALDCIAKVNAWANAVQVAGYEAGLYVGAGCPLTSTQLSFVAPNRYWHSCSYVGAEPSRGFCMRQLRPDDVYVAGVKVDVNVNVVEYDYRGDVPMFVAA